MMTKTTLLMAATTALTLPALGAALAGTPLTGEEANAIRLQLEGQGYEVMEIEREGDGFEVEARRNGQGLELALGGDFDVLSEEVEDDQDEDEEEDDEEEDGEEEDGEEEDDDD